MVILDVDPKHGGDESFENLNYDFSNIPMVRTGGDGRHFYFKSPKGGLRNSVGSLGPGLDIRAEGGQVVAPPSIHPETQKAYVWEVYPNGELPEFPKELLDKLIRPKEKTLPLLGTEGEQIQDGQRNSHLTSLAGSIRKRGMSEEAMMAALQVENRVKCNPTLPEEEVKRICESVSKYPPDTQNIIKPLKPIGIEELLRMEMPPREDILSPWLPSQGLAMIHAYRGIGKTFVGLEIAFAIASGGEFLGWKAHTARGVLYLDGEMPANVMQKRLAEIVSARDTEPMKPFILITPDLQEETMPDLATTEGQELINQHLTDEIKLVVVDNLSCLVRSGKENEAETWQPVQSWALGLRKKGISVLFLHHTGKSGLQRGTSRREDVLDTVIHLKRPVDYSPEDGAVFEVHFEKSRGIYGEDVAPFEAALGTDVNGQLLWTTKSLELCSYEKVVRLANEGLNQKEISDETSLHKSSVSRYYRKATNEGLIR